MLYCIKRFPGRRVAHKEFTTCPETNRSYVGLSLGQDVGQVALHRFGQPHQVLQPKDPVGLRTGIGQKLVHQPGVFFVKTGLADKKRRDKAYNHRAKSY